MKKDYYILIALFIIAVLFNAQMDIIRYAPSRAWFDGWWIASNWQQAWWQKYLLGWTVDGWHLCKMIVLSSFITIISYFLKPRWLWWLILMVSWGILFNVFYKL